MGSETHVKALVDAYWRLRSYAIHDDDCNLNKPPYKIGSCSCGLTKAIKAGELAADMLDVSGIEHKETGGDDALTEIARLGQEWEKR